MKTQLPADSDFLDANNPATANPDVQQAFMGELERKGLVPSAAKSRARARANLAELRRSTARIARRRAVVFTRRRTRARASSPARVISLARARERRAASTRRGGDSGDSSESDPPSSDGPSVVRRAHIDAAIPRPQRLNGPRTSRGPFSTRHRRETHHYRGGSP